MWVHPHVCISNKNANCKNSTLSCQHEDIEELANMAQLQFDQQSQTIDCAPTPILSMKNALQDKFSSYSVRTAAACLVMIVYTTCIPEGKLELYGHQPDQFTKCCKSLVIGLHNGILLHAHPASKPSRPCRVLARFRAAITTNITLII